MRIQPFSNNQRGITWGCSHLSSASLQAPCRKSSYLFFLLNFPYSWSRTWRIRKQVFCAMCVTTAAAPGGPALGIARSCPQSSGFGQCEPSHRKCISKSSGILSAFCVPEYNGNGGQESEKGLHWDPYNSFKGIDVILWCNKSYIFGLHPWFLDRAPETLGISWMIAASFVQTRWLLSGSQITSRWGLVARKSKLWLEAGNFQPVPGLVVGE